MPQVSWDPARVGASGPWALTGMSLVAAWKLWHFPELEFCFALLCFKSPLQGQVSVCPGAWGICVLADKRKAVN